jgi:energy-coupling factor transport system substrate-specific component
VPPESRICAGQSLEPVPVFDPEAQTRWGVAGAFYRAGRRFHNIPNCGMFRPNISTVQLKLTIESQIPPEFSEEPSGPASRIAVVALIPSAVAFNIALAQIVLTLKLPLYLDCVGIITTTLIAGLMPGLIVCALAFAMMALLFNHIIICFIGTAAIMAVITHLLAKVGWFKTIGRTIVSGLILGVVSAVVSAPVSVKLFGGVTTAGSTFVTAWLIHRGFSLWASAFLSGLICDTFLDKTLEALLAVWLVRAVPRDLLRRFGGPTLAKNFNLKD